MSHQIERTLKQAGPAPRTFLKHLSGGIAAALLALFSSNALAQTGTWQKVTGPSGVTLKQISVGSASAIWVLDTAGYPWKWTGSAWQKKAGTVSTISAASDGTLWATNPTDSMRVLKLDLVNNKWTSNIPPGMKQVTAVNATTAWGLDNAGTLFRLNGTTWEKKSGTVSQISVGRDGTLWATHPPDSNRVLFWTGMKWYARPAGMVSVSVGSADTIWALDSSDQVFKWSDFAWQKVPGALRNIAAAGDGTVWGLTAQGSVYKWAPPPIPPPSPSLPAASRCNSDGLYCCNAVQPANSSAMGQLLGLVKISVEPSTALVGSNCTPIDLYGIGAGGACTAQPVCCLVSDYNGLVVTHCTPVTMGL